MASFSLTKSCSDVALRICCSFHRNTKRTTHNTQLTGYHWCPPFTGNQTSTRRRTIAASSLSSTTAPRTPLVVGRFLVWPNVRSTALTTQFVSSSRWYSSFLIRQPKSIVVDSASFKVARIEFGSDHVEKMNMSTTELLKAAGIYARDLLTLGATSRQERRDVRHMQKTPAAIVPKDDRILVSFGDIRAIVGLKEIYLLDAHRPSVQDFAVEIMAVYKKRRENDANAAKENNNSDNDNNNNSDGNSGILSETLQTNEIVFLEGALRSTVNSYNRRVRLYEPIVHNFLDKVSADVYSNTGVHLLAPIKDSLQSLEISVRQAEDCLASLLDDDDAMLNLLLTEQKAASDAGCEISFDKHEPVEILIGVYARQLTNILSDIKYMLGRLQSKQEFVALAMASYRNRLVQMNVNISIAGLSLAVGTTVAGFFGMNLVHGFEENPMAFPMVVSSTGLAGLVVAMSSFNYISGSTMKRRAQQRLDEIETLGSALSDMCALDYTLKHAMRNNKRLGKYEFKEILRSARRSRTITDGEVELLFEVFDKIKNDGEISSDDLPFLDFMQSEWADDNQNKKQQKIARSDLK